MSVCMHVCVCVFCGGAGVWCAAAAAAGKQGVSRGVAEAEGVGGCSRQGWWAAFQFGLRLRARLRGQQTRGAACLA